MGKDHLDLIKLWCPPTVAIGMLQYTQRRYTQRGYTQRGAATSRRGGNERQRAASGVPAPARVPQSWGTSDEATRRRKGCPSWTGGGAAAAAVKWCEPADHERTPNSLSLPLHRGCRDTLCSRRTGEWVRGRMVFRGTPVVAEWSGGADACTNTGALVSCTCGRKREHKARQIIISARMGSATPRSRFFGGA